MTALTVDTDIPSEIASDLFGKSVSDLQTGITVGADSISGTLKYIADYSAAGYGDGEDSGNYLALHAEVPDVTDVTITCELVNGVHGPSALDSDGTAIFRIADKNTQKVKFTATKTGCDPVTRVFSLKGLTLNQS